MYILYIFLIILTFFNSMHSLNYLTEANQNRLKLLFEDGLNTKDCFSLYFSVNALKLLGYPIPHEKLCSILKSEQIHFDAEKLFYFYGTLVHLTNCKIDIAIEKVSYLKKNIESNASLPIIFYSLFSLKYAGKEINEPTVFENLKLLLTDEKHVLNLGYALHIASNFKNRNYLKAVHSIIPDILIQADEVDGKYHQFEGGLVASGLIMSGIYKISDAANIPPPISDEQAIKFVSYFLNRKSAQTIRGAYYLVEMLKIYANNNFHKPVSISLESGLEVSKEHPHVIIHVSDILGNPLNLKSVELVLVKAKLQENSAEVLDNISFIPQNNSRLLFSFDLYSQKLKLGFYNLYFTVKIPEKSSLLGCSNVPIIIKILSSITKPCVEVGVMDSDHPTLPNLIRIEPESGSKKINFFEVDNHQKLLVKFDLQDINTGLSVKVHQAFVRFQHLETQKEIIFIGETDTTIKYKFDLDLTQRSKDFSYLSGVYNLELLIGDHFIDNSFSWLIAKIKFNFGDTVNQKTEEVSPFQFVKPEIKHTFRAPEKNPSIVLTQVFSVLVILPFLLLVALVIIDILIKYFHNFD